VLAWSQGVATLANAFHDVKFIREEVRGMDEWLSSCVENAPPRPRRKSARDTLQRRAGQPSFKE
jgi:TetR/AcrR family transcriptional regulator, transcriptional repressor for nem operon